MWHPIQRCSAVHSPELPHRAKPDSECTMRYFILVLLYLCQPLAAQQWERLPLNGGQFDKLVQNPYNEVDIIGYNRQGNFFRSVDGGNSWERMRNENFPFHQGFMNITFDLQGRIYVTSFNGLWRSDRDGVVWDSIPVPGSDHYFNVSQTKVTGDGSIFVWDSDTKSLYKTTDDGVTWKEIGPSNTTYDRDFSCSDENGSLILVLKRDSIVVTTDGGVDWIPYSVPGSIKSSIHSFREFEALVFRLTTGSDILDIYESRDTGKTWHQLNQQKVRTVNGDCNTGLVNGKHFHINDSVDIIQPCKTLLRSTDSGRTFLQLTDFLILDVVLVDTVLVASVPIRGVLRSTDYGDTWSQVPSPPMLFNFGNIEFAHAHDDTMFVLFSDGGSQQNNQVLLESDDGGMTWDSLFTSSAAYELFVDAGRPSRFYLHVDVPDGCFALISGVAGQHVPDTLLITTSIPRPHPADVGTRTFRCVPSERFPGWIYVSKHTSTIGWSSNFGTTWQWFGIPASVSAVTPWPSQVDPMKILIVAIEKDPMKNNSGGFFYTPDGGFSFHCVSSNDLGSFRTYNLYTTSTDRYFLSNPADSSTIDYGCSWERMQMGIDSSVQHIQNFQTHGELLVETESGIYIFRNERWQILRDHLGNSLWTPAMHSMRGGKTIFFDKTVTYIYVLIPLYGLYRIKYDPSTNRIESGNMPGQLPRLRIYPNPANSEINIYYAAMTEPFASTLFIFDVLGRTVWTSALTEPSGVVNWSFSKPTVGKIPAGLYFVKLQCGIKTVIEKVMVLY